MVAPARLTGPLLLAVVALLAPPSRGDGVYRAQYDASDQKESKHPYVPTGFMLGNAGLGHALLRLALVARGKQEKLVSLADHPFAHKRGK